jgi:hypothetical protein
MDTINPTNTIITTSASLAVAYITVMESTQTKSGQGVKILSHNILSNLQTCSLCSTLLNLYEFSLRQDLRLSWHSRYKLRSSRLRCHAVMWQDTSASEDPPASILRVKMEAAGSSKTWAPHYNIIQHYNPEDLKAPHILNRSTRCG